MNWDFGMRKKGQQGKSPFCMGFWHEKTKVKKEGHNYELGFWNGRNKRSKMIKGWFCLFLHKILFWVLIIKYQLSSNMHHIHNCIQVSSRNINNVLTDEIHNCHGNQKLRCAIFQKSSRKH